jgi:hypothetical protein
MVSKEKLKAILKRNPAILTVEVKEDEERAEALAHVSLRPSVLGALTLADYNKWVGELALDKLVSGLVEQCNATNNGDLKRTEALLTVQAHTLDAIFRLSRVASYTVRSFKYFFVTSRCHSAMGYKATPSPVVLPSPLSAIVSSLRDKGFTPARVCTFARGWQSSAAAPRTHWPAIARDICPPSAIARQTSDNGPKELPRAPG